VKKIGEVIKNMHPGLIFALIILFGSASKAIIKLFEENGNNKKKEGWTNGKIGTINDGPKRDLPVSTVAFRLFILFLIILGITLVGLGFVEDSIQAFWSGM
jgi:hypothetical protein